MFIENCEFDVSIAVWILFFFRAFLGPLTKGHSTANIWFG